MKEDPVRTKGEREEVETHPAYGMIGASRVSASRGPYLFGSDLRHQHFIKVTISKAEMMRTVSHDWPHARQECIEVYLSEAQWATFVSTPNVGMGVPCTLSFIANEPPVPEIGRVDDKRERFKTEMNETIADALKHLEALDDMLVISNMPAKVRDGLKHRVAMTRQELLSNTGYVAKSFDEHVERTVEHAKTEVNTYLTGAIMNAGITALTPRVELLEEGKQEHDAIMREITGHD